MSQERYFTRQQVEDILKRAIELSSNFSELVSEDDLMLIASELNIDPSYIRMAIESSAESAKFEQAKVQWGKKKRREFFEHFIVFLTTNFFLISLPFIFLDIEKIWVLFLFPVFWAIGLAVHFFQSFFPSEESIEKGARKLLNKERWRTFLERTLQKLFK